MHRESPLVHGNYSVGAAVHRESPLVHLLWFVAQQQMAGLLLLRATVPAGQLQLVRPLAVGLAFLNDDPGFRGSHIL